jgi:PKD domain
MKPSARQWAFAVLLVIPSLFVACGGGGGNPPPSPNNAPVAAFTAASPTIKAGEPLLFTSSSSDPDGDALTQSWDFGDETRGGGSSIGHVFVDAGSFAVKLTVADGKGDSSSATQSVTVTAGAPVGPALNVTGTITDQSGAALAGVTVKLGSSVLGTSDSSGQALVSVPTGAAKTLMLSKTGFVDQVVALEFPLGSNETNASFKSVLLTQGAVQSVNATTGGMLKADDNAMLVLPANGLETASGAPVTGNVEVSITPLDTNDPYTRNAYPGRLEAITTQGESVGLVTLGMIDFTLKQNGEEVNLKPGSGAKVHLPLYADVNLDGSPVNLGDTMPLWSLSEKTGEWVQEGTGIVVDTGNGTRALEATVTHFSSWNIDHPYDRADPKPKCLLPPNTPINNPIVKIWCKEYLRIKKLQDDFNSSSSLVRPQATVPVSRFPGWNTQADIELGVDNVSIRVPSREEIYITSCADVEGKKYCGRTIKTFPAGSTDAFDIMMFPIETQAITLPFDATKSISDSITRRYEFVTTSAPNTFSVRVEPSANANAIISVYNALDSELISSLVTNTPRDFSIALPTAGKYIVEVAPSSSGSQGTVRTIIQTVNVETALLPFDAVKTIAKTQRLEFTALSSEIVTVNFERTAGSNLSATARLFDGNGTALTTGAVNATALTLEKPLLITGKHILEIAPTGGSSGDLRVRISTRANTGATWKPFYQVADTDISFSRLQKHCFASTGNATGRTLIAWTERKTNNYNLRVSQYDPVADSFESATTLATNNNSFYGQEYRCQIAVSSNNDAMVIWWLRGGNTTKDLFWSRRAAGSNAWSAPATLTTASTNYLFNRASELQIDANGNASVVWLEQHAQGTSSQLRTARYSPTSDTWTTSVLVAPVPSTKLSIPSLSSDSAGNQMVLYKTANQGAGSAYPSDGIYVQKFDLASTTWLAPTLIKTMTVPFENDVTSDQINPIKLKIGTSGHVIAVWSESSAIHSARMNPSTGVWTVVPSISVIGVPAVEVSATGVATAVFYSNPSSLAGQGRYQTRTLGVADAAWSTPTTLLQNDGGGNYVLLAMNPSGDAATVFQTFSTAPGFSFTTRSSSSNTWTAANKISEANSASTVSIDSNGQALVVRTVKQTAPDVSILEYQRIGVR